MLFSFNVYFSLTLSIAEIYRKKVYVYTFVSVYIYIYIRLNVMLNGETLEEVD